MDPNQTLKDLLSAADSFSLFKKFTVVMETKGLGVA
jgi:hypothetical protein